MKKPLFILSVLIFTKNILVLLIILLPSLAFAQAKPVSPTKPVSAVPSKELIAQLEKSIPQLMKDGEVPGLSIAIIKDAKILWQQNFGVANSATKQPVAENTIFEAASLSK
ncbi:MAG TPA: serine hydrolase, partial [Pyrinomonadaceae bacterium]|nr:serine hydrolase [Pyrinomonadaceae bacterium]